MRAHVVPRTRRHVERFAFVELEAQALATMAEEGFDSSQVSLARSIDLHYTGQLSALRAPMGVLRKAIWCCWKRWAAASPGARHWHDGS